MDADTSFHVGIGMIAGSLIALPGLLRAWHHRQRLAPQFLRWFLLSYGLGAFSVVPSVLRRLGMPDTVVTHPIMNIFVLHPFLNRIQEGGLVLGGAMVAGIAACQYLLLLAAIKAVRGWL
jgi:hypothetical protein